MKKIIIVVALLANTGCAHVAQDANEAWRMGVEDGVSLTLPMCIDGMEPMEVKHCSSYGEYYDDYFLGFLEGQLWTAQGFSHKEAESAIKHCAPILGYHYDEATNDFEKD